ncbi:MAG: 3-hydroxyacyl-CoA dehydrogenase NAD-binding domain-containing protein [Thermodesulfobacteriota bacterium]|nr:3-hydroxyacyl-CoA dehydrogenase NAD-binding domain-containing protein [Thermodesulfobacteriota bacterium]
MDISNITCVGAGLIGQGWATLFSAKGYQLILQDIDKAFLEDSVQQIKSNLILLEKNGLIDAGEADAAIKRIKTNTNLAEAVSQADYVQESIPDDLTLKKQIFKEINAAVPDHTILASSTSGLLMTEIQKATANPSRCVLVHPVLPVYLIPLVEIVGGDLTSPKTVTAAYKLMEKLGKTPVLLKKEVPGYIINRLQAALMREAFDLVATGVASAEDVDKAFCKGIGLRDPFIGPLLRAHLAGNGIENFLKNYDQSYRNRWQTMATWTAVPSSTAKAVIQGVKEMEVINRKNIEEIKNWRDNNLLKLLKITDND